MTVNATMGVEDYRWLMAAADALEEERQERARESFIDFVDYLYPRYKAEPVHRLIAGTFERVLHGEIKKLMVFAPPQTGKSMLASVYFPAYWLSHRPHDPIILTSYAASLAVRFSRQARSVIEDSRYKDLFPSIRTEYSSRAADMWDLADALGSVRAAGAEGAITGHGARLGIIDDPFEDWHAAYSEGQRERIWTWYRTTFRTRVWEDGAIVIIMTRWHLDDLAGRLLQTQGNEWTVLRLPALAETQEERDRINAQMGLPAGLPDPLGRKPGEALAPQRFSADTLKDIASDVGSLAFAAEYQGAPTLPEGSTFKRQWFKLVDATPNLFTAVVRYWDKAATRDGGDYSAGVKMGIATVHGEIRYYILNVIRGQWSAGERNRVIQQTARIDGPDVQVWVEQEPGSGGKESAQITVSQLAGYDVHAEPVTGAKEVRARPFAAQCEAGNVYLLRAPWNETYIEELCAFPAGAHDDQVDGSSGAFNKLTLEAQSEGGFLF